MLGQMRRMRWGLVACLSAGAYVAACSDGFSSSNCRETRTCPRQSGEGGEVGANGDAGAAPEAASGGLDGAIGGEGITDGGTVSSGGADGTAGSGPVGLSCPEGYQPWLTSGFSFPDGVV